MITQVTNKLIEVRQGRKLFVRHWILASSADAATSSSKTINLVCVHGTAASQEQYLPLWESLEKLLIDQPDNICIHAWAYDAIGCGQSPIPSPSVVSETSKNGNAALFVDEEQVQDLLIFMEQNVGSAHSTFFVGHSYGPNWIYKYLQKQSSAGSKKNVQGLILISTRLRQELVNGGPTIFKVAPMWLLRCLQPLLTASFLKMGFSPTTHKEQPELVAQAKLANNQNDMQTCIYYYQSHDWFDKLPLDSLPSRNLVLHGIDDELVPIHCGQVLANHLGTELVSIPNSSHMVLIEQPTKVAQHILQFVLKEDVKQ